MLFFSSRICSCLCIWMPIWIVPCGLITFPLLRQSYFNAVPEQPQKPRWKSTLLFIIICQSKLLEQGFFFHYLWNSKLDKSKKIKLVVCVCVCLEILKKIINSQASRNVLFFFFLSFFFFLYEHFLSPLKGRIGHEKEKQCPSCKQMSRKVATFSIFLSDLLQEYPSIFSALYRRQQFHEAQ